MPALLLLKDDTCERLVDLQDLDSCTTVAGIKEALGLPKSAEVEIAFKERQLSDATAPFRTVHAPTATLTVQAVQGNLFTNGWFPAAPTRVYAKVLDLSWSPMRHADFMADLKWLLAMALLLCSIQQALAVLP